MKIKVEIDGRRYDVLPGSDLEQDIKDYLKWGRGVQIQRQQCCQICTMRGRCALVLERKYNGTCCAFFRRSKGE